MTIVIRVEGSATRWGMDREDTPTETASEVLAHVADLFPSAVVTVTAAHLDQLDGRKPEVVTLTNGGRR